MLFEKLSAMAADVSMYERNEMADTYKRGMAAALVGDEAFGGISGGKIREEIGQTASRLAFAAQELAYSFYLHHHEVLAEGAIAPESFVYAYLPNGMPRPMPTEEDRQLGIIEHLRNFYPHTLPSNLR